MAVLNEMYAEVRVSGEVTEEDAQKARRAIYGTSARIARRDVEMLFQIEEAADRGDPAWEALLVEVTVDHLVHETEPTDELNPPKVTWLLDHIVQDGKVKTARELEVLISLIDEARSAPEPLVALALNQVRLAVVSGEGPLAGVADADPGRITREETALVRRILYAFGEQVGGAITRAEAEIVFDINDAATGRDNDPEWADLFVKTIANCIMAVSGYQTPPRQVALAEDDWSEQPTTGIGGFFSDLAVHGLKGILDTYIAPKLTSAQPGNGAKNDANTPDGGQWLAERIGRDGNLDDNEKALLRFIRDEAPLPYLHPALQELIGKAA